MHSVHPHYTVQLEMLGDNSKYRSAELGIRVHVGWVDVLHIQSAQVERTILQIKFQIT